MRAALGLVGCPAGVRVGHVARARGEEPPRGGASGGKLDDGLAEFGPKGLFAFRLHAAHDGFEHDGGHCAGELELAPFLAVARRGETEIRPEVEIRFLGLDGEFAGVANGKGG